ncbi:long-chain acyl-CoA thioesterase FadM [bacterium BMS3Abin05]|nr:long-chain acyl-CoA thioesterase FadM [bacterium BMS3Abin05]GBE26876.1 long-chain acyl-CoA thioesterase FadM [bacterium BMS3Bbin03]HDZ11336.1 acyl-CoA thioesterase [Bacteroidota bacterium]
MGKTFKTELQVRSYELDFYGHVNNAIYLNYLEYARGNYLEQVGFSFKGLIKQDVYLLVARVEMDYKAPAHMSDWLEIEGFIEKFGTKSLVFRQIIRNRTSAELVLDARSTLVFVNGKRKTIPIPDNFKEKFL